MTALRENQPPRARFWQGCLIGSVMAWLGILVQAADLASLALIGLLALAVLLAGLLLALHGVAGLARARRRSHARRR